MHEPATTANGGIVRMLGDVAAIANDTSDLDAAVRAALDRVCAFTGWPIGQAFSIGADGTASPWLSRHDPDPRWTAFEQATGHESLGPGVGLPGRVVATGRPASIGDVGTDANFPRAEAARRAGLHGAFAFPVTADGHVVAVLEFLCSAPSSPAAEFLAAVSQLGMHVGRVYERLHAHTAIAAAADRTRQIIDSAGEAFVGMDADGRITEWNHQAENVFGWPRGDVLGRQVADVIVPEEFRERHRHGVARFLASGEAKVLGQRLDVAGLYRDGTTFPLELTLWALPEGGSWSFYAFARDITARKKAEADLVHDALHDALTGLANRTALQSQLTLALNRTARGLTPPALLFIDLDRFKPVNDNHGHEAGDQVLVVVAERLRAVCRPQDLVARLAGDEFVVLLDESPTARDATLVAARIVTALSEPVVIDGRTVRISASVGVALARPDSTPESLIHDADDAMYQAKTAGPGRYDIFGEQMRERVTWRLQRETELARALDEEQLELFYQPVFALEGLRLTGVEALLRWRHPERGMLLPGEFIDVAEESNLIVPIGAWVLERACRQLRAWQRDHHDPRLLVSVNLSARQLEHADLAEQVSRTIAASGLSAADLQMCLEVTESAVMHDPQAAATTLEALRDLGVRIALDDFGTGYSSLAYLKWFPIDIVKIDRSFVASMDTSTTDRSIVRAVIGLARELGLTVVAEGVETEDQLALLTDLGATHAQGFLLGRPQPAAELTALLEQGPALLAPQSSRSTTTGAWSLGAVPLRASRST